MISRQLLRLLWRRWIEEYGKHCFSSFPGKLTRFSPPAVRFSFFIQYNNQAKKGKDFRLRFLWRLFLLFIIGYFNGRFSHYYISPLFYNWRGARVSLQMGATGAVLIAAIILMLQPLELGKFFYAMMNPDYVPAAGVWRVHSQRMYPFLSQPDFWAMVKSNLWDGQLFSLLWAWGYGRFFQTASLFLLGMLIGRRQLFANLSEYRGFWMWTLVIGAVCFVPLYFITASLPDMISNKAMLTPMNTVVSSFRNFSFMCVLVACFVFLWQQVSTHKMLHGLVPYER